MIKKRNAQGLPLNTIIIAIIVLIVLVVLIFIFTGQIGKFGRGIDSCSGRCADKTLDCDPGELPIAMNCNTDQDIDYCCMKSEK